jgi:hypothetical protein
VVKFSAIANLVERIRNLRSEINTVEGWKKPTVEVSLDPDREDIRTELPVEHILAGMKMQNAALAAKLRQMGVELD